MWGQPITAPDGSIVFGVNRLDDEEFRPAPWPAILALPRAKAVAK